jgi:nitrite reductase (NADH) large subunit
MSDKRRLVVVGNGMAGARTVEEILARGSDDQFEITMFGDEPYGNYNRTLLSNVLSGVQEVQGIFLNPLEWYAANGITLHAGVRVTEIISPRRIVVSEDGREIPYDQLIIATGSHSFIPPLAGLRTPDGRDKPGVYGFRGIDDCNQIMAQATKSRITAVIGGGLLGLEAARGLINYGCEVHVINLGAHLMSQQLDAQAGAILKKTIEAMGIYVHLNPTSSAQNENFRYFK